MRPRFETGCGFSKLSGLLLLVAVLTACSCERYSLRDHPLEFPENIQTVAVTPLINYSYEAGSERSLTRALIDRSSHYGMTPVKVGEEADLIISGELHGISDRAETLVERRDGELLAGSNRLTVECSIVVRSPDGAVIVRLPNLVVEELYPEGTTPSETSELRAIAFERIGVEMADRVFTTTILALRETE